LQIVSKRENFSLRERITKEGFLKNYLVRGRYPLSEVGSYYEDKFVLGINLIHIFSKFHPQFLINQKNSEILDVLREKWVNKV